MGFQQSSIEGDWDWRSGGKAGLATDSSKEMREEERQRRPKSSQWGNIRQTDRGRRGRTEA